MCVPHFVLTAAGTYSYRLLLLYLGCPRVGFVPNPDPTRIIWVEENMARNRPSDLVGFFRSSLVNFGLYRFGYRVYRREQFLAGFGEFWLKSGLNLLRSGWNLAGFVEIWPGFCRITARSRWILSRMLNISPETLKVSEIWSGMLNISLETLEVLVRVKPHRF